MDQISAVKQKKPARIRRFWLVFGRGGHFRCPLSRTSWLGKRKESEHESRPDSICVRIIKRYFAVFAYEFKLSQYDVYSSTSSSKIVSNPSLPRPSMISLKRSIAMPIESVACF